MPKAFLIKMTTNEKTEVVTPKMIIGRSSSEKERPVVDHSADANLMVSRIHAVILYKDEEYYLVDCGALNKTFLNDEELAVNAEYILHDNDVLRFANEKYRFRRSEE